MVPRVYPGAKPLKQNLPCKRTFGEETYKPFAHLYIMIHNSWTLAPTALQ